MPFNKKLWTGSYALLTIGLDLVALAVVIHLVEMRGSARRGWMVFFEVFGKNTLFIYLLSELAVVVLVRAHVGTRDAYAWLYGATFQPLAPPKLASLLFAATFMLACWLAGYLLDRRGIVIKV